MQRILDQSSLASYETARNIMSTASDDRSLVLTHSHEELIRALENHDYSHSSSSHSNIDSIPGFSPVLSSDDDHKTTPHKIISPKPQQLPTPSERKSPSYTHKRIESNPFEILYEPEKQKPMSPFRDQTSPAQPVSPMSPKYLEIEKSFQMAKLKGSNKDLKNTVSSQSPSSHPIVTIVDQLNRFKRSGSIVSRSASLRNRNKIKSRNKIVRRSDLPLTPDNSVFNLPHAPSRKLIHSDNLSSSSSIISPKEVPKSKNNNNYYKDKLRFLFPVKRKTSLKRRSSYSQLDSKPPPKFKSKDDIDDFFLQNNVESLLKEILPHSMKLYDFKQLIKLNPNLVGTEMAITLDQNNQFTLSDLPPKVISAPLQDTFIKTTNRLKDKTSSEAYPKTLAPPVSAESGTLFMHTRDVSNLIPISDMIYARYRAAVFSNPNRFHIPPRFYDVYPDEKRDDAILNPNEVEQIEKKVLLEVLIRRTVAAKIEYRLKQNGVWTSQRRRSAKESQSSTTITSRGDDSNNSSSHHSRKSPSNKSHNLSLGNNTSSSKYSSNGSNNSMNTDHLMQQNASLFSEFLPSPQISYTSDIFGSGFEIFPSGDPSSSTIHPTNSHSPRSTTSPLAMISERPSGSQHTSESPLRIRKMGSNPSGPRSGSSKDIALHDNSSSKYSSHNLSYRKKSTDQPDSPVSLYVNDFNVAYYAHYKKPNHLQDIEQALLKSNVYQLKPMMRSNVTISSSISDGSNFRASTPPQLSFESSIEDNKQAKHGHVRSGSSTDPSQSKRESQSTNETCEKKRQSQSTTDTNERNRSSQSTTNTSMFQGLDDLSKQLSGFIKNELHHDFTAPKAPVEETLPAINQSPATMNASLSEHSLSQHLALEVPRPYRPRESRASQTSASSLSLLENLQKHGSEENIELLPVQNPSPNIVQTEMQPNPMSGVKSLHGSIKFSTESEDSYSTALQLESGRSNSSNWQLPENYMSSNLQSPLDRIDEKVIFNSRSSSISPQSVSQPKQSLPNRSIPHHQSVASFRFQNSQSKLSYSDTIMSKNSSLSFKSSNTEKQFRLKDDDKRNSF